MTLWAFNLWIFAFKCFNVCEDTDLTESMATINKSMGKTIHALTNFALKHLDDFLLFHISLYQKKQVQSAIQIVFSYYHSLLLIYVI